MEAVLQLTDWAKTQNIVLNGISPEAFEGRGIGLIATRKINEGEVILEVPVTAIKTLDTIPESVTRKLPSPPDMTVHGLLALDLAKDASGFAKEWRDVLPSREDIATLPLTWDARLHQYLPSTAKDLLKKQQQKFARDYAACQASFPDLDEDTYKHAWLLVNSRTFYHTTLKTSKLPKEDHLSLQPVADLFNHATEGCKVAFTEDSYTVTTNRAYARGDELPICYGRHSNDFLLVEYGFILADNTNMWDEVSLDELLLPKLRKGKRDLEDAGFWGRYMLDTETTETVCFRTQVALRYLAVQGSTWLDFANGADSGEASELRVQTLLKTLFEDFDDQIDVTIEEIANLDEDVGNDLQRETITKRWQQIQHTVQAALARLAA